MLPPSGILWPEHQGPLLLNFLGGLTFIAPVLPLLVLQRCNILHSSGFNSSCHCLPFYLLFALPHCQSGHNNFLNRAVSAWTESNISRNHSCTFQKCLAFVTICSNQHCRRWRIPTPPQYYLSTVLANICNSAQICSSISLTEVRQPHLHLHSNH